MKKLYAGFDLCAPNTSVSMTINGPAPIILAMYFNTAIDQQVDRFRKEQGREPSRGGIRRDQGPHAALGARHGSGGHPEGGSGAEHLHLLHGVRAEDDGRHPGILHRARHPELLFRQHFRLPHRRGRRQSRSPSWPSPWPMPSPMWSTT